MSGVNLDGREIRKGAADAISKYISGTATGCRVKCRRRRTDIPLRRNTACRQRDRRALGVIHLKDIVKGGISERFAHSRPMGIRTVMITGDNPLTAAAIAREAGVDDFLAEATPKDKMDLIRKEQAEGKLVAMTGDGTNDAPALAQADVGVAMNTGTQAAKEAGNMVDLDSNPTKLIEVVEIGKQLLDDPRIAHHVLDRQRCGEILRHHSRDVCRHVPGAERAQRHAPEDAQSRPILSAVIFNALIIIALDSAGAARREVSPYVRRSALAPQSARSTASAASSCRSSVSS